MEKPDFLTNEEWLIELEFRQEQIAERQKLYDKELKQNPPLPPWLKYPEANMEDMFWSMGAGQSYLENYVLNYFDHASDKDLEEYKNRYLEPPSWSGWYSS